MTAGTGWQIAVGQTMEQQLGQRGRICGILLSWAVVALAPSLMEESILMHL